MMAEESAQLDREFRLIELPCSSDHLDFVLATAYVASLLGNVRFVRDLAQFHAVLLNEFQKIADMQKGA